MENNFIQMAASAAHAVAADNAVFKNRVQNTECSVRVFCAPNVTILLVYTPAKIKMGSIWKDDFFSKIGIFCKSIAGVYTTVCVRRKDRTNYPSNELRVTIHEINTSRKKRYMADPIRKNISSAITSYQISGKNSESK